MLSRSVPRSIPRCRPGPNNGGGRRTAASSSRANFLAQRSPPSRIATAAQSSSRAQRKQQQLLRSLLVVGFAGGAATISQYYINNAQVFRSSQAEAPPQEENPIIFEAPRKKPGWSKEDNRDMISSQHHQVKRSWENPGVYAWGSNSGRVVAPDSTDNIIKTPRRIKAFDGMLLRDIKMDRNFGAAIDDKGNLLQWGTGYAPNITAPVATLKGKNLHSLTISRDRILALSGNGKVYSLPVSAADQAEGAKPSEASWIPFWSGRSDISYRTIAPKDLAYSEKVTTLAGGLEHALLLTNTGRLFSAASASDTYPSRGQLGIPGLSFVTRPEGPYDQPHEITTLRGFNVTSIACGDRHSLILDKEGRLFSWGDNSSGQLGFDNNAENTIVDAPSLLPIQKLYPGSSQIPIVTRVAAGGSNSYITVEATRNPNARGGPAIDARRTITADTYAFGSGITGSLGNNRWTHVQTTPSKIPTLSGLFEYDETTNTTVPIRLASLSVGATHAAAVMQNITYLNASDHTSTDDTNWGADVVFWGGNEHFQLGTGRRNNVNSPVYLEPLDQEAEVKRAKKSSGAREEHRFHITPRAVARLGDGRKVEVEQKVECGNGVTCVYSST